MSEYSYIETRLVVPRNRAVPGNLDLPIHVSMFLESLGAVVQLNEKLLRLPPGVPAVLTGVMTKATWERFLTEYPYQHYLVATTVMLPCRRRQAA